MFKGYCVLIADSSYEENRCSGLVHFLPLVYTARGCWLGFPLWLAQRHDSGDDLDWVYRGYGVLIADSSHDESRWSGFDHFLTSVYTAGECLRAIVSWSRIAPIKENRCSGLVLFLPSVCTARGCLMAIVSWSRIAPMRRTAVLVWFISSRLFAQQEIIG